MKKYISIAILLILNLTVFSKNIEINFNVPTGKILFYKYGDENTREALFYDGHVSLNLDDKEYSFVFSSPGYPIIQKQINVKDINCPLTINFTKNNMAIIKGNVKNKNLNIGGAKVTFLNSQNKGYDFTTDIFGNFTANIPKGNYRIYVTKDGYTLDKKNAIVYEFNKSNLPYTVNLKLIEIPSFIKGQAVDENGNSIPYPEVSFKLDTDIVHVKGDEFGIFKLNVNPGVVTILCEKEGYTQNGTVRNVEKNSSITNIEIPLTRIRATISGIVTDGVKPIRGAKVILRDNDFNKIASVKSDENGFYEFYKIPSRKEVFITVMNNNNILKKSETFDLEKDIKNFNLILDK